MLYIKGGFIVESVINSEDPCDITRLLRTANFEDVLVKPKVSPKKCPLCWQSSPQSYAEP